MASSSDSDKKSKADRVGLPFEPKGSRKGTAKDKADSDVKAKRDSSKKFSQKPSSEKKSAKSGKATGKSGSSKSSVSASAQAQVDQIRAMNRRKSEKFLAEKAGKNRTGGASTGRAANSGAIPEAVSRRMLRRMAILSGSPVVLGVGIFFLAYYLRSHEIVEFAPVVVLLSTMGCFGLGVLGLTYGVLSASWDSEPGSLVGFSEFKLNFGRVMDARRASKT